MKKLALILIALVTLYSCGDELEFNTPAIQGNLDGNFYRARSFAADIDFGGFIIQGSNNIETVQLITQNDAVGVYELGGENSSNVAFIQDANGVIFSTANEPDPDFSLFRAEGQISIENISDTTPRTITGTFWFNAYTSDGLQSANFNEGVFFEVPLTGGLVALDNSDSCQQATSQVNNALAAFNATDTSMPEYMDICVAYRNALLDKIDVCGDPNGTDQNTIDDLGDCTP